MTSPFDFSNVDDSSQATESPGSLASEVAQAPLPATMAHPPTRLLGLAGLIAGFSGALAIAADTAVRSLLVAWFLAGPVAVVVFGLYLSRDTRARANALYTSPSWLAWAVRLVVVLIGAAVVVSAWGLADWAARR